MSEESTELAVVKASGNFSMAMFKKVQGLSENSPLRKMQGQGALRLTVDGNQFQIKKGSKVVQTLMDGKKPAKELDIVIHMVSPLIQKQAAVKYDPRDPKFEPLGCWSNDGNKPDDDVWNKQSHSCDTCKFGKGADAKDSRTGKLASCGLTRLAVVSLYQPNTPPEDIQYMLMNFNWSSNSTKKKGEDPEENQFGMINYLSMLAGMEVETHRVVTRLVVDDWSDPKNNCKLLFQPVDTIGGGDANYEAHTLWEADVSKDMQKDCLVTQREPQDDAPEGDGGAPEKEDKAPAKASKKKASKKKAAAKKTVVEDDLDDFEEPEEELPDEPEEELVEEDDDDFDLDSLLED